MNSNFNRKPYKSNTFHFPSSQQPEDRNPHFQQPRHFLWKHSKKTQPIKRKSDFQTTASKKILKDFMSSFKDIQTQGFYPVFQTVCQQLNTLPSNLHWKLYMELADLAKRDNKIDQARALFSLSTKLQPHAHSTWLQYSKLEQECGRLQLSQKLLLMGLQHSPTNDQLAIKYIKTEEKLGNLDQARKFLGSLQGSSVEKNWKILIEGALMEARAGEIDISRHCLQLMMQYCPNLGAVYIEAVKFEDKWGQNLILALKYCESGLNRNMRFGPLWFNYLRILDKLQYFQNKQIQTWEIQKKRHELLSRGSQSISKELVWKLYLEFALSAERNNQLSDSRKFLKEAVIACPQNLRWKVWVVGARMELQAKNFSTSIKLLHQSLGEVPAKQKPLVLVELSKTYQSLDNIFSARDIMIQACESSKQDWKVYLEYITMQMRNGNFQQALKVAKQSLGVYSSTGRLWAALIQLKHTSKQYIEEDLQYKAFVLALNQVPKSGQVWCEGARIRMNPFTKFYNLEEAELYLGYAIQFTPQYGDSFIQMMRLYLLQRKFQKLKNLKRLCLNADPNYGMLWFYCKKSSLQGPKQVWKRAKRLLTQQILIMGKVYTDESFKEEFLQNLWTGLVQVNKLFRNRTTNWEKRKKLIFGSESPIF